jgi:hypothetical protein
MAMQEHLRAVGRIAIIAFVTVAVTVLSGLVNGQAHDELVRSWATLKELGSEWLTVLFVGVFLFGLATLLRWGLDRFYD